MSLLCGCVLVVLPKQEIDFALMTILSWTLKRFDKPKSYQSRPRRIVPFHCHGLDTPSGRKKMRPAAWLRSFEGTGRLDYRPHNGPSHAFEPQQRTVTVVRMSRTNHYQYQLSHTSTFSFIVLLSRVRRRSLGATAHVHTCQYIQPQSAFSYSR